MESSVISLSQANWLIFAPTLMLYVISGALLGRQFFANTNAAPESSSSGLALKLMTAACLGHAVFLVTSSTPNGASSLGISEVAAVLALLVTATMLVLNRYIRNTIFLPAVCGVSALFLVLYIVAPDSTKIVADMSVGLVSHIILSLFSFGALSLSFIYAIQLSYISHQLKSKKLHLINKELPPLLSVEIILAKLMFAGTVLLFIALASGFIFVPNMFADGYAHKTILSLIAFAVYGIALAIHKQIGLRSRVLALVNFIGLGLLTLAYFGSRIVAEIIL